MKQTAWKYPGSTSGPFTLLLPTGARFLHAAFQEEDLKLWFLVEPAKEEVARRFLVTWTGEPLPVGLPVRHLATVINQLVWHLFEVGEDP